MIMTMIIIILIKVIITIMIVNYPYGHNLTFFLLSLQFVDHILSFSLVKSHLIFLPKNTCKKTFESFNSESKWILNSSLGECRKRIFLL